MSLLQFETTTESPQISDRHREIIQCYNYNLLLTENNNYYNVYTFDCGSLVLTNVLLGS